MLRFHLNVVGRIVAVLSVVGCVLAGGVLWTSVWAASFPQKGKPITLIVTYSAGGSTDVMARVMAGGLEKEIGTPVMVVNKPGAGGGVAYTELSKAKPDGYTIGTMNSPAIIGHLLDPSRKAVYTKKSFQPLALHVIDPALMAVRAESPFKSVKDIIDAAKAAPKKVTISTAGLLGDDHFGILQMQQITGARFAIVHFPQGGSAGVMATLGGKIDVFFGNGADLGAQTKAGTMRVLGIMDKEESPFFPGVKTFEAQGIKLYWNSSRGYIAPRGITKEIAQFLSEAIRKVITTDENKKKMAGYMVVVRYMGPDEYSKDFDEREETMRKLWPLAKMKD